MTNQRKKQFIADLEAARDEAGYVQEWFTSARKAVEGKAHYLQVAFLSGAIPEVFSTRDLDLKHLDKRATMEEITKGRRWREQNPPDIVGAWFKGFRFEKPDGLYTYYRLPLDPKVLDDFIKRVKRSKSFV